MKKKAFVIIFLLVLSLLPFTNAQPWITVFEGKVKIGETLVVGDYRIKATLEKNEMKPYAIVYEDDEIMKIIGQWNLTEVGNIRIILGGYDAESKEVFVSLQYRPSLVKELRPEEGFSFEVGEHSITIVKSSSEKLLLKVDGREIEVKASSTKIYNKLALEYADGILKVYYAKVEVKKEEKKDYEIYYPFTGLKVVAGSQVQIPIEVRNNGNEDLTLQVGVVSKPLEWEVKLLDEKGEYEVSEIFLKPGTSAILNLLVKVVVPELGSRYYFEKGGMTITGVEARERVTITIKVPKTTPAGTYQITITGKGDQAQASTQITVRVTQSSSSAYIGVFLLVITFVAVAWMIRRVGRR